MSFIEIRTYSGELAPESPPHHQQHVRVDQLEREKTQWLLTLNPNERQRLADFFTRIEVAGGTESYFLRIPSEDGWQEFGQVEARGHYQIVFSRMR